MRIGIDMGGMSIKIGLVNRKNEITARKAIPTRLAVAPKVLIADIAVAVRALLDEEKLTILDCEGIGIGSPGTIDNEKGVILYSNNFGWEDVDIISESKKLFAQKEDLAFAIANDADVAALGEVCAGAAKTVDNAVLLTLGTGVGGGVILNGKIFHGAMAGGCEPGHMTIVADGERCTCGRKGCLEAYASASALLRMAKKGAQGNKESLLNRLCDGNPENMNGKIPFDAAAKGDAAGTAVVEEYENYLACGIANVINIFRPQMIILGGGVAAQKENLTIPLQEKVKSLCFGGSHGQIAPIVTSQLGNDAGIIGAANLIAQK